MADFKPLKGKVKRREFLVLDIESKDGPTQRPGFTRPFMVGVYTGTGFHLFTNKGDLPWDEAYFREGGCIDRAMRFILRREHSGKFVYAHNAGRFDYLFLLPWLMHRGSELGFYWQIVPVASSIQMLKVYRKGSRRTWTFLDSYKLIPTSFDKAAKAFGLEGKVQHDLSLHESDPRWVAYLKGDCVGLYDVLVRFHHYVENVLCGEVGMTAPSTAVKLLRRRYLKAPIPRNEETHEFVRSGYYGGRVEVFRSSGEGLRYYDFNSSYPASMLEMMPGGVATWWEGTPPARLTDYHIGFCDVEVEVPEELHIPPLPIRIERGGTAELLDPAPMPYDKLIFPVGRLRGVWEWTELQMALEVGCRITRWHRSAWYVPIPLFERFVRDLYRYRDKSQPDYDEGLASVVKIMLNSTYGKFGMKTLRKKIYRWDDPELPDGARPANGDPDCPVWYAEEEADACYVMPQIAARVTALSRVKLYRAMMASMDAGGSVYYCDTDSVITTAELPSSTALGELKDELPEYSGRLHGKFIAPKLYMLWADESGETVYRQTKAKGVEARGDSKSEKERELQRLFETLATGGTITMKRLEKVGSLAQDGFSRGPKMITVPRTLKLETGKRLHLPDGSTRPFRLRMW